MVEQVVLELELEREVEVNLVLVLMKGLKIIVEIILMMKLKVT